MNKLLNFKGRILDGKSMILDLFLCMLYGRPNFYLYCQIITAFSFLVRFFHHVFFEILILQNFVIYHIKKEHSPIYIL